MSTVEVTLRIDEARARMICGKIRDNMTTARDLLVELYEGRGWEAMGYKSWRECAATEFGQHQATLYRQLEAAQVEKELAADPDFAHVRKTPDAAISDRNLRVLKDAPEGTRAEVLKVATEAAGGKPTEKAIKAAVEAKWADPEATAAELVKTVVNGVAKADPAVEKLRESGRIPANVVVEVEDPGDEADDVDSAREAAEERAAKADELPDDEWLAGLPLYASLAAVSRDRFRRDALYYRRFDARIRRSLKAFHGVARNECFKGTSFRGFVSSRIESVLRIEHPSRWHRCPATDKGGCDGAGSVPMVGECPTCRGRGYLPR